MTLDELVKSCQGNRTKTELAAYLGLSRSTLVKILNGERKPGLKVMNAFIAAFPDKHGDIVSVILPRNESISTLARTDGMQPAEAKEVGA